MTPSQAALFELVKSASAPRVEAEKADSSFALYSETFGRLGPCASGRLFANALFLGSACQALIEHRWLLGKSSLGPNAFAEFLRVAFARELESIGYLAELWQNPSALQLKAVGNATARLGNGFSEIVSQSKDDTFRAFVAETLEAMAEHNAHWPWKEAVPGYLSIRLDRTFDLMDKIFRLQYERDHGMPQLLEMRERLYEGAGEGVQTSYATILTALSLLKLPEHAHVIDLGSGYGRLGLVIGIARPDLRFTGYEYVGHRVEVAEASALRSGISTKVKFLEQDLARRDFEIPSADVYYLYDPFCAETYARVLARLHVVGSVRPIIVVTHCDGGVWFAASVQPGRWHAPEVHDGGTLRIFRSIPT